jgi:hypothetical protein
MLFQDRAHRGLMAVGSATTAGPQPQARSTAEDGRARVSCFARNARSAGEESRSPAVAGSRLASNRERIAALDPPAAGRRGAAVPSCQGGPCFRRLPPLRRRHPPPKPCSQRGKARSTSRDRMGGSRRAVHRLSTDAAPKQTRKSIVVIAAGSISSRRRLEASSSSEAISASGALNRPGLPRWANRPLPRASLRRS